MFKESSIEFGLCSQISGGSGSSRREDPCGRNARKAHGKILDHTHF